MNSKHLLEAVKENRIEFAKALLNNRDVCLQINSDFSGHNLLHFATLNNSIEMSSLLIHKGSNVSAISKFGKTPLHLACQLGFYELAKLFIENGADVNARDLLRMTPLHFAVERNNELIVKLLCEHKHIDLNSVDKFGRDCFSIANQNNNSCLLDILNKKMSIMSLQKPTLAPPSSSDSNNPFFSNKKVFAKSLSVNSRHHDIYKPLINDCSKFVTTETIPIQSASTGDSSLKIKTQVPQKKSTTVRIDILSDSSDESNDDITEFNSDQSKKDSLFLKKPRDSSNEASRKKHKLSYSPNTVVDDTLYWLKRKALFSSPDSFSLGNRELSLTEAGKLTLKYLNDNDPIHSEKSLFKKLVKSYQEEELKASNESLNLDQSNNCSSLKSFKEFSANMTLFEDDKLNEDDKNSDKRLNLLNLNLITDQLDLDNIDLENLN